MPVALTRDPSARAGELVRAGIVCRDLDPGGALVGLCNLLRHLGRDEGIEWMGVAVERAASGRDASTRPALPIDLPITQGKLGPLAQAEVLLLRNVGDAPAMLGDYP